MSLVKRPINRSGWNRENGKLINLGFYLTSYTLLWYGFVVYVEPKWAYYGFILKPNSSKIIESLVLLVVIVVCLPSKPKKPSDFLMHIHALLPVLPMLVLYGASNHDSAYTYFSVAVFLMLLVFRSIPISLPIASKVTIKKMLVICIFISFLVIVSMFLLGGYRYLNFNLFRVYEFRRSAAASLPSIFGYISPGITEVVIPFALILSIYNKNKTMIVLSLFCGLMMYGLTSHKSAFFYPVFVLSLYYFCEKGRMLTYLLFGYMFVIAISLLSYHINPSWTEMINLFLRRTMFTPANANYGYHIFFSEYPHVLLSSSKFTFGLIEPVYDTSPTLMLGEYITGRKDVSANTGWLGTSFMHFGYYGMVSFSFVIGLLLAVLDALAIRKGSSLSTALAVIPFFSLFLSSDLPTVLMTHGLILALILLWLLKIKPNKKKTNRLSGLRQ